MIQTIKLVEIIIALIAIAALFSGSLLAAFIVLLALGTQSAFFSPCKFAILPQHLEPEELIGGNALVTTGTYLAILAGTIIGAILAPIENGKIIASGIILVAAIAGYVASRFILKAPPPDPNIQITFNIFAKAIGVIKHAFSQPPGVLIGIMGVSFFYFVAATFHAQFPNFTKQTLGADNIVLTMFMVVFSVGIAIGGLLNHKILKGRAHGALVPISCLFMAAFGIDIYFAAKAYPAPTDGTLHSLATFLSHFQGIRLMIDTTLQAIACGFFVIPLRAIVQDRAKSNVRSRVISSSNMMDALFILLSSIVGTTLLSFGISIEGLYLTVSIITLLVGFWLFKIPSLRASHLAQ